MAGYGLEADYEAPCGPLTPDLLLTTSFPPLVLISLVLFSDFRLVLEDEYLRVPGFEGYEIGLEMLKLLRLTSQRVWNFGSVFTW